METVLIQINDLKAYKLLESLEDLQIIKVLKKSKDEDKGISEKFGGKLHLEVAEDILAYISKSRKV